MENIMTLQVQISPEEKETAKKIAKSKGMLFSGYIGQLIRKDILENSPDYGKFKFD